MMTGGSAWMGLHGSDMAGIIGIGDGNGLIFIAVVLHR